MLKPADIITRNHPYILRSKKVKYHIRLTAKETIMLHTRLQESSIHIACKINYEIWCSSIGPLHVN